MSKVSSIQVLYISLHKPLRRSVEFSVHCVVWVSLLSKLGWKGLKMTHIIKMPISLWLLNQIGCGFATMQIISYRFIILKQINFESYWWRKPNVLFVFVCLFVFWGEGGRGGEQTVQYAVIPLYRPFYNFHSLDLSPGISLLLSSCLPFHWMLWSTPLWHFLNAQTPSPENE